MKKRAAIYLCGSPGSGKTALSRKLQSELSEIFGGDIELIDGYAEEAEQAEYALGGEGTYLTSMVLWAGHLQKENQARMDMKNFITCGGLIERLAHAGLRAEIMNAGVKTPENDMRVMREIHAATMLSFMLADTFSYSYVFYLPRRPGISLPGEDHKEAFYQKLDLGIRTVLDKFNIPAMSIEGTIDEQAEKVVGVIKQSLEKKIKENSKGGTSNDSGVDTEADTGTETGSASVLLGSTDGDSGE